MGRAYEKTQYVSTWECWERDVLNVPTYRRTQVFHRNQDVYLITTVPAVNGFHFLS